MKTTAINKYNAAVTRQSGRVGNVRYVNKNGETYVRSATNSKKNNPRSSKQMVHRMKFASMMAYGTRLKNYLTGAFPQKEPNQSDVNAFVQANKNLGVYRTKEESMDKVVIALPAMISRGGLGAVTCTIASGVAKSNIPVGDLTISASTSIKDLTAALMASGNWENGDQLTIISAKQVGLDVSVKAVRIYLDKTDTTLLSTLGTFSVSSGCLCYAFADQGCIGFIHSNKKDASKSTMAASTEQQTLIASRLTDEQYALCAPTYGESKEKFIGGGDASQSGVAESQGGASGGGASEYTITVTAQPTGGGSVTGGGTYASGASATLTATANPGYKFNGWADGVSTASRSVTVNADKTYTAKFKLDLEGGEGEDDPLIEE